MMADETSTDEIYENPQELSDGQSGTSSEAVYENTQKLSEDKGKEAAASGLRQLLLLLGILCVLVVVSISIIIWISVEQKKQEAALREQTERVRILENQTGLLVLNNQLLKNQTEQLSRERDHLNQTLEVIMTFDNFSVTIFCPNKTCQLCQDNWIRFHEKCYWFYESNSTEALKTWDQSRQFCQNHLSDLVVINNLQEQEFVLNHTKGSDNKGYAYWIGLQKVNNVWVWINGHEDTLGFWSRSSSNTSERAVLLPGKPLTQSWLSLSQSTTLYRFICEDEVLLWPN